MTPLVGEMEGAYDAARRAGGSAFQEEIMMSTSTTNAPVFSPRPSDEEIRRARVFAEPLVPSAAKTDHHDHETAELAAALTAYLRRADATDVSPLARFLGAHPGSAWVPSLLVNLGLVYRRAGYVSRALEAWEQAWPRLRGERGDCEALANLALGELAELNARLGRRDRLEELLASIREREITGPATEKIAGAREGAWLMAHQPGDAFRCGPCALDRVLAVLRPGEGHNEIVRLARSSAEGTSLAEVSALAAEVGLSMVMVKREDTARVPVPAVVHWKAGHFAALIGAERIGGELHYLLQDPTFGHDQWISQAAVDDEASGYFLLVGDVAPDGFRVASAEEGESVWGRGNAQLKDPEPLWCNAPKAKSGCDGQSGPLPMAQYDVHGMLVSLNIVDTPVGYAPPVGPAVLFTVTYNQRDSFQPAIFTFSNLGPKWTFDWLAYVTDDPSKPGQTATVYRSGGGRETFTGFDAATQRYRTHYFSRAGLVRTSAASYERRFPSGGKQVFAHSDGATVAPRRLFMTELIDPHGNSVKVGYDTSHRIVTLTDAVGRVTKIDYELANDPLKITKVTDPFGRSATFEYAGGRLVKIVDVIGIASELSYTGDFVSALTTPYGKTTFAFAESGADRWIMATDPLGDTERVEFRNVAPGIPFSDPASTVPSGVPLLNQWLNYRNTFYWDKEAWHDFPGDYTKARLTHWLHTQQADFNVASSVIESEKTPLENRVWYSYAGQSNVIMVGSTARPATTARMLDDRLTQAVRHEYSDLGKVTRMVDPFQRETIYVHATNQIDLIEVRQKTGNTHEVLAKFAYDERHLPVSATNAAGQVTTYAYNTRGQLVTVTNPKQETTTIEYDSMGRVVKVIGPGAGSVTSYEYDEIDRVRSVTDPEGYTITTEYDALDRPTKISYPDGSSTSMLYDRLHVARRIDRLGRTTTFEHDALRRVVAVQDPAGRRVLLEWCKCGGLVGLTDPRGQKTTWKRDLNRRIVAEVLADGTQKEQVYEKATSRLKQVIDAKGQTTTYDYYLDDLLKQVSYANAQVPTPAVAFTYDPNYPRPVTMTDGMGVTRYTYRSPGESGAPGIESVDEPRSPGVRGSIAYDYDELGRVVRRTIDGAVTELEYDASGRCVVERNALGTFTYAYDGPGRRIVKVTYPNQQTSVYAYFDAAGDHRLREITNLDPRGEVLSRFDYTYDVDGRITRWGRSSGDYTLTYDFARQLAGATLQGDHSKVTEYAYEYDAAGNRTREQIDKTTTVSIYNAVNELVAQHETGPSARARALSYDANGNTLSDGERTFEWDAANRLSAVVRGSRRSELSYDGLGRRVQIVERQGGKVEGSKYLGWCNGELCVEYERDGQLASKPLVARQFFAHGFLDSDGPTARFVARDHLGSVHEMTDQAGKVVGRYDYDPYGVPTPVHGQRETPFGYAGYYWHAPTGLNLTQYRAYEPTFGRWLSRDPIGLSGGTNLYSYVLGEPMNARDPSGLFTFFDPGSDDTVNIFLVNSAGWGSIQKVRRCKDEEKNEISAAIFEATALVAACPGVPDDMKELWLHSLMNDMYACGGSSLAVGDLTCGDTVTRTSMQPRRSPLPSYVTIYDETLGGQLCGGQFSLVTTVAHEAIHSFGGLMARHSSSPNRRGPAYTWSAYCTIFVPLINKIGDPNVRGAILSGGPPWPPMPL